VKKILSSLVYVWAITLLFSSASLAQTTTADITGEVTDASGAVLPGARVTVTNTATGVERAVSTNEKGVFLVPDLPPGPYQLSVALQGFETLVRTGITLVVGQHANLPVALKVGAVTEQVTVMEEAPLVNTSSSEVSGVVGEKAIEELPLNGRDFSQLPLLEPAVSAVRNSDPTVANKGYGTRLSMGGSRADQTAWLLDGTNIKSMSNFGTPGSAAGVMLGVDAMQEFQVLTSNYGAQFSRSSGGVINMVSKSGTNNLHGSAYEFLRNSDLDARNFFDIPTKPAFKRNQFGASIGGPIKKDRTFFFGNYEGLRQREGITELSTVPNANTHMGLIPAASGGGLQQVTIAPEIVPYLNLWPLPNGPALGGGSAELYAPGASSVTEDYFVIRVDHHLTDKQSLFARFTFDQGNLSTPDSVPINNTVVEAHSRFLTIGDDYILSPQFLASSRVAFNRTLLPSTVVSNVSYPASLNLFVPGQLPSVGYPGVTGYGPQTSNIFRSANNLYQFQESFLYTRGNHSLKFGGSLEKIGYNRFEEPAGATGSYQWATLPAFLADSALQTFSGPAIGNDTFRTWVWYTYGFYLQDDWKVNRRLTLNLGVRYEPYTIPSEKHDRVSTVENWVTGTGFSSGPGVSIFQNPSHKDISPRVGFAWDVFGDGKTAVRGGFGIFFIDLNGAAIGTPGDKNPPFAGFANTVLENGKGNLASSVADLAAATPALLSPAFTPISYMEIWQYNMKSSYEMKTNLTVARQLPGNWMLSVGYLGDRGIHLWSLGDANDAVPTYINGSFFIPKGTPHLNPNTGTGTIRDSSGQSFYNALNVEATKRFSHSYQLQIAYSWSKNIDDQTTGIALTDYTQGAISQEYNPRADRGLSALNLTDKLVVSGVYDLPSPARAGFAKTLLGGWQIANIFSANTGTPFSAFDSGTQAPTLARASGGQHPNLVAGRSFSSFVLGNPNQYFDTTAFSLPAPGYFGNAGRDIISGPGLVSFDMTLKKITPLSFREGASLEFHADFFNLFNDANFGLPATSVYNPSNGQVVAGVGLITRTITTSRQLQFGLRLTF